MRILKQIKEMIIKSTSVGSVSTGQRRTINNLQNTPLTVVDVGCRWGFAERFVDKKNIGKFQVIGFDPDVEECLKLEEKYQDMPEGTVRCIPLALAGKQGTRRLHVTKEPACSSLHKPIEFLYKNYPALDCISPQKVLQIDVITMAEWAKEQSLEVIDYIKIDTQGSELEILKGFDKLLNTSRCIDIEVEFNPIYQGQSLFSETDLYLRSKGFMLWRLSNLVHYSLQAEATPLQESNYIHFDDEYRQEMPAYGGQLFWADARYIHSDVLGQSDQESVRTQRDITLFDALGMLDIVSHIEKEKNFK